MKAPEKIYVDNPNHNCWYYTKESNSIEYTRTDAFIEKAENFIYSALNDGIIETANIEDFLRLFKNYMRGE